MKKIILFILSLFIVAGLAYGGVSLYSKYQKQKAYEENVAKFTANPYFNENKLDEYLLQQTDYPQLDIESIILKVNYNLNETDYIDKVKKLVIVDDFNDENFSQYYSLIQTYSEFSINTIVSIVNENWLNLNNIKIDEIQRYLDFYNKVNLSKEDVISLVNYDIDLINTNEYELINSFTKEKYYINKNLKRYLEYYDSHYWCSLAEVIKRVNSNIDYYFYSNVQATDMSKDTLVICNKFNKLDSEYVPDDLVTLPVKYSSDGARLVSVAANAFIEVCEAAEKDGVAIRAYGDNGYRSYNYQASLYNYYAGLYGVDGADECSARPGYSEHQTGLAIDITLNGSKYGDMTWMIQNCWKYGFIYRYQGGQEYITGYQQEDWHYRYVGVEVSTFIHDNNITYEEYYAYYVADNSISTEEFISLFN